MLSTIKAAGDNGSTDLTPIMRNWLSTSAALSKNCLPSPQSSADASPHYRAHIPADPSVQSASAAKPNGIQDDVRLVAEPHPEAPNYTVKIRPDLNANEKRLVWLQEDTVVEGDRVKCLKPGTVVLECGTEKAAPIVHFHKETPVEPRMVITQHKYVAVRASDIYTTAGATYSTATTATTPITYRTGMSNEMWRQLTADPELYSFQARMAAESIRAQIALREQLTTASVLFDDNALRVIVTNTGTSVNVDYTTNYANLVPMTPEQKARFAEQQRRSAIRAIIKNNLLIRGGTPHNRHLTPAEVKARNTLRDLVTEAAWRRYIANGFLMVAGRRDFIAPTGLAGPFEYQLWAHQIPQVYKDYKRVAALCIHSDYNVPPTDHVINIKFLVEFDELSVWKGANVREPMTRHREQKVFQNLLGRIPYRDPMDAPLALAA